MLNRLSYSVRFPSTGKTIAGEHDFAAGMTAITGPNGTGKSFLIEMIRYAFFGSAALRGTAADYDRLSVSLEWDDFQVVRNSRTASLHREGEIIAVGTTPVNAKIVELLGFNLKVFDIAHCVKQGEIAALSTMTATERKRMVDSVIGMGFIDELIRWCHEQAREGAVRLETLQGAVVAPVEPAPLSLPSAGALAATVAELEVQLAEKHQLEGWLSHPRTEPVPPEPPPFSETVEELEEAIRYRQGLIDEINVLKHTLPAEATFDRYELSWKRAELDAWNRWQARQKLVEPEWDSTFLDVYEDLVREHQAVEARNAKRSTHLLTCPKCEHQFHEGGEMEVSIPPAVIIDVAAERRKNAAWDAAPAGVRIASPMTNPGFTAADLDHLEQLIDKQEDRKIVLAQIAGLEAHLVTVPDHSADLRTLIKFYHDRDAYAKEMRDYLLWAAEFELKTKRRIELDAVPTKLAQTRASLELALQWRRDMDRYEADFARYSEAKQQIEQLSALVTEWRNVKSSLEEMRTKIKTYLIPSISKVASTLISKMTQGVKNNVVVDENFDIFVDNQPISTLSGAERSTANLSIRVALGQVLTARHFSFISMDEYDSDMDEFWAPATAECIRRLTAHIDQIFVVSHKDPEADHYIRLAR
jgi:DNA repair exonuclease SbcCD ATPase subunit